MDWSSQGMFGEKEFNYAGAAGGLYASRHFGGGQIPRYQEGELIEEERPTRRRSRSRRRTGRKRGRTVQRRSPPQQVVPQAQVDPSMVPDWEDLQLDPRMTPPPPTDRGQVNPQVEQMVEPQIGEGEDLRSMDVGPLVNPVQRGTPPDAVPGLPPGSYVGPGGQGGGDMGEGELGLPSDIGAPGMGGVEEMLPATTGYNPALGTGYVPPGGVQEEPDQLPQGAGLTDTSGGNTPTLWARNQYLMANPGSTLAIKSGDFWLDASYWHP
jgi:hypothetical protein